LAAAVSPNRRFALALFGLILLGFAVRLAYALAVGGPTGYGDDRWYHDVAKGIAEGRGFADPFRSVGPGGRIVFGAAGDPIPTAFHLPLFPAILAVATKLGLTSFHAQQVLAWGFGAGTVGVCGLIGRRLGGERLGLLAALAAAVYLPLAINDSFLKSESLFGLLVTATLLAALRLRELPTARRALVLGVAIGLASLTRSEALLFVPLLAPVVLAPGARRTRNAVIVCAAVAVLVVPWCVRNTTVFDQPTGLTTGVGSTFAGANLHSTYYGPLLGGWSPLGIYRTPSARHPSRNEAVQSDRWLGDARRYTGHHLGRLPLVLAARVGRTWSLYPLTPALKAKFAAYWYGHLKKVEYVSLLAFVLAVALAVVGGRALRRRSEPLWILLTPMVLVTVVSLVGYGDLRFRQAADVALAILAAAGCDAMLRARSVRSSA
jgi:hypothetical protein